MPTFLEPVIRYGIPIALASFAAAGGIFWFARRNGEIPPAGWAVLSLLSLIGLATLGGYALDSASYHVFVTVLGPDGRPLENAKVWTIVGEQQRKTAGGWQLDVPASARSTDGKLLVWAATDPGDMKHSQVVPLGANHHPSVTIRLGGDREEDIQGRVLDEQGQGIEGAWVSIAEREDESVQTDSTGKFILPAHAPQGTNVLVHIAAGKGYDFALHWVGAGDHALALVVNKK